MAGHVVLLGDSIFDNASYVPEGPSVTEILRNRLPRDYHCTVTAIDGACVSNVYRQLAALPEDATHLVLSIGGNDALIAASGLFTAEVETLAESLNRVARAVDDFAQQYRQLTLQLCERNLPLAVCTVYDAVPGLSPGERSGLSVFNDVISRTAFRLGMTLIDLRLVCDEPGDYSEVSPIEPSAQGGGKIVAAILSAILEPTCGCRVVV